MQLGLRIGCLNVRGIIDNPTKRVDLNTWMVKHQIDVMCLQEVYVPDNEKDLKLEMAAFPEYNILSTSLKALILYKSCLKVIIFDRLERIVTKGLDISWIAIETERNYFVIGSCYHSPSHDAEYSNITHQMNYITDQLKPTKREIVFSINGDFNAKNTIWGSTKTDVRGQYCCDWIGINGLDYLNTGTITHVNKSKKEVLDLMTISNENTNMVKRWSVHRDFPVYFDKVKSKNIPFSDHYGLIAVINVDPICHKVIDRITWNLQPKLRSKFIAKLDPLMKRWRIQYERHKMDKSKVGPLADLLQLLIVKAAQESFGYKKFNSQSINWLDKKIHYILNDKKRLGNKISHLIFKLKKKYG